MPHVDMVGYVPIENFGADHWSTLVYAETVIVDYQGFQVGCDPRMRQGRRHLRVMWRDCPSPRRSGATSRHDQAVVAQAMDDAHSTVLRDGTKVIGHDDWHCVQDLIHAGFMGVVLPQRIALRDGRVIENPDDRAPALVSDVEEMEPGSVLRLTPSGEAAVAAVRRHRSAGGGFAAFEYKPLVDA